MDLQLKDKVAVITGGSVGIGLAVAEGLAAEGVNLVLAARQADRVKTEAARVADKFKVRAVGIEADVAAVAGVEVVVRAAETEFGGADILINNAGTGSNETIMEAPNEKSEYYWNLHVMAAVRLARGLVPSMRKRGGGVILHNGSVCTVQPLWYEPIYNTTKAALLMFSKTLANELIKDNIRVNTINPGLVLTPDWIKTAKQLTADKGGRLAGPPRRSCSRVRPDRSVCYPGRSRPFLRFHVFIKSELFGGFCLYSGRRYVEGGGVSARAPEGSRFWTWTTTSHIPSSARKA